MKHLKHVLLLLLCVISQAQAVNIQERSCGIWVNEVPVVADTLAQRLYIALRHNQEKQLTANLRWDNTRYQELKLDGTVLTAGDKNLKVNDWTRRHTCQLSITTTDNKQSTWTVEFTNLPLVLIEATQNALFEIWKKDSDKKTPTVVTVIDPNARTFETTTQVLDDGTEVKTNGEGIITFTSQAGVRVRGATSAGKDKKPFAVELTDEDGNERDMHLLGYRNDGDWILDAMFNDPLRMRNRLITDVWNEVQDLPYEKDNEYQRNGTDGEYVEIFLKGRYWGLYCFTDKIDRKKLNLKKTKDEGLPTEETRGLLWKSLFRCTATTFSGYTTNPVPGKLTWEETDKDITWEQKYPDDRTDQGDFSPIAAMIDVVGMAASDEVFLNNYDKYFYLDNLIDYHIFTQALQLQDNLQKNMYLSVRNRKKGEQLLITPWDLDASLGRTAGGDAIDENNKWFAFGEQLGGINYLMWRLANKGPADYKKKFYNRWRELRDGTLSVDSLRTRMTAYADQFTNSGAYAREYELWNRKMVEDLYGEIEFVCNFLTRNYTRFDEKVKGWDTNEGGNENGNGNNGNHEIGMGTGVTVTPAPVLPYSIGYAVKIVTINGDSIYCMFSSQPEITFPNGQLQLTTKEPQASLTWIYTDVDYFTFQYINNPDPSGIKSYAVDPMGNSESRYFTLDGVEVNPQELRRGIYILKQGNTSIKFIKK